MGNALISGIGQGIAQGQQQRMQQEMLDAQKSLIKAQAKAAEMELDAKAKAQAVMGPGLEQMQNARPDGTMPTPYQNAGQQAPQLLDLMTKAAMASGDIGQLMKMQEMQQQAGVQQQQQALYEKMMQAQQGGNVTSSLSMGPQGMTVNMDPVRGSFQSVTNPDGSQGVVPMNPFTGRPMGENQMNTAPAPADLPASPADYANFVDRSGNQLQGLMSLRDLSAQGIRVTTDQRKQLESSRKAMATLNEVNSLASRIFPRLSSALSQRGKEGAFQFVNRFTQSDPDSAILRSMTSELVTMVRALGDVGAISDTQLTEALNLIPVLGGEANHPLPDTPEVARGKIDKLYRIITSPYRDTPGLDVPQMKDSWKAPAAAPDGVDPATWGFLTPEEQAKFLQNTGITP